MTVNTDGRRLAAALPDIPRLVETRAMLLLRSATVTGGRTPADGFVVRVLEGARSAVAVHGRPPADAIRRASGGTTGMTPILAQVGDAPHVEAALRGAPEAWQQEAVVVHVPVREPPLPGLAADAAVRLLAPDDPLDHLPAGLRHEITHAREMAPVAAVVTAGRGVSFCYPCWTTESLWDVSVDTLEGFRGRGFAAHAARFMTAHLQREGRTPVWGAVRSNDASLRLAAKLGYESIDETVVFSRGAWAFLTAGFTG